MAISKSNLFKLKKALLKLSEISTEEGTNLIYDEDELEVGIDVFVEGEEGLTPAEDGVYTYDSKTIEIVGGKIASIELIPIEQLEDEIKEDVVEEQVEEQVEEVVVEPEEQVEEVVEDTTEDRISELEGIIEEQKTLIEDLKRQLEEANAKLNEPSAEAAEEVFKKQEKQTEKKIDFSKYIKRK